MYIVNEYQTNEGVTAIVTPFTSNDRNAAESAFYAKCSAAAISTVEVHTVTMCTEEGFEVLKPKCFKHPASA